MEDLPPSYDSLIYNILPEYDDALKYEGDVHHLEAPPMPFLKVDPRPARTLDYNPPDLDSEDVYEACIRYISENICYGSKFLKEMTLTEITNGCAFHYVLESFGEKRESVMVYAPYSGQYIDGPGPSPGPWDIVLTPQAQFKNGKAFVEIPHTSFVKPCAICLGQGGLPCETCNGQGRDRCSYCRGSGRSFGDSCSLCHGTGKRSCKECKGKGTIDCRRCDSRGCHKHCRMLSVTWTNHPDEFISNTTSLPNELIKEVKGYKMIVENDVKVMPIFNSPDQSVNLASGRLIEKHSHLSPYERILRQRQVLRAVPLTKVSYQWRDKQGEFYVYGEERRVYFKDYPQKNCCCTCL